MSIDLEQEPSQEPKITISAKELPLLWTQVERPEEMMRVLAAWDEITGDSSVAKYLDKHRSWRTDNYNITPGLQNVTIAGVQDQDLMRSRIDAASKLTTANKPLENYRNYRLLRGKIPQRCRDLNVDWFRFLAFDEEEKIDGANYDNFGISLNQLDKLKRFAFLMTEQLKSTGTNDHFEQFSLSETIDYETTVLRLPEEFQAVLGSFPNQEKSEEKYVSKVISHIILGNYLYRQGVFRSFSDYAATVKDVFGVDLHPEMSQDLFSPENYAADLEADSLPDAVKLVGLRAEAVLGKINIEPRYVNRINSFGMDAESFLELNKSIITSARESLVSMFYEKYSRAPRDLSIVIDHEWIDFLENPDTHRVFKDSIIRIATQKHNDMSIDDPRGEIYSSLTENLYRSVRVVLPKK